MYHQSNVDENFFIDPSTPEAAYVLGFLWGDGSLYHQEGTHQYKILTECSAYDLDTIAYLFEKSGKWTQYRRHRTGRKPQLCILCHNKKLYQYLESYNYKTKSGSSPIIINSIVEKLKHYWWRGFFDADGCIYVSKNNKMSQASISSTFEQDWSLTTDLLNDLDIQHTIKRQITASGNKYSYIRFVSKKSIMNFYKYIYQGEQMGLQRKLDKFKMAIAR